jgi:hypothetical protein
MLSQEEWEEYQDYLNELTDDEFEIEMKWLQSIGEAKQRGSTVVQNNSYYDM